MYKARKFDNLLGLSGFSDKALQTHFKLYNGYVDNTNKIDLQLVDIQVQSKTATPEFAELKRRFAWEFNGMRLHEYHFEALTKEKKEINKDGELYKKLEAQFQSFENWKKDFMATASMRGIGWVILYYDEIANKLFNVWVNEHDNGHLAGCKLLLNLDLFEHAFLIDHSTNKAEYINTFMDAIDWDMVEKRFK